MLLYLVAWAFVNTVKSHSWIHCSDYRGSVENYEEAECYAHPRPLRGHLPANSGLFGLDIGFNQQPDEVKSGVQACHGPAHDYLEGREMARYRPGQVVTLAWPSKNHVAAPCTNAWIPDTRVELYVAPFEDSGHPTMYTQVTRASFTEKPHVNGQMDFRGFQNCPKFCENMDKALCTGDFTVPDLEDGLYTFQWVWEFNQGTTPYVTCFEAYVGKNVAPVKRPTSSPTVQGAAPVTARPTIEVDQSKCLAKYAECGGTLTTNCCGAAKCYVQSKWYSQCLDTCPRGWECFEEQPVPTPTTPRPATARPTPTTARPTPTTARPTALITEPDWDCAENYDGTRGTLQKPSGMTKVMAVVKDACACAKFCTIFAEGTKAFLFKEKSMRCNCYEKFRKFKKRDKAKSFVGSVPLRFSLDFTD